MNRDIFTNDINKDTLKNIKSSENKKDFLTKKTTRKKTKINYSNREEERILKYALKLSENEQKIKQNTQEIKPINNYFDFEECKKYYPSEEDFKNPIAYFDKLWSLNESDTGIIKIIPPESWKKNQNIYYKKEIYERANSNVKNLSTRKQNLGLLYKAKVHWSYPRLLIIFFIYFLMIYINYFSKFFKQLIKNITNFK